MLHAMRNDDTSIFNGNLFILDLPLNPFMGFKKTLNTIQLVHPYYFYNNPKVRVIKINRAIRAYYAINCIIFKHIFVHIVLAKP